MCDRYPLRLSRLLSLVLIWFTQATAAELGPAEQLARMADALHSLSYEGTPVYLYDNRLESLRVVHRVEDGQIREHLVALNGPIRTLTRGKGGVTCELSASHSISVPGHGFEKDVLRARMPDLRGHCGTDGRQVYASGECHTAGPSAVRLSILPGSGEWITAQVRPDGAADRSHRTGHVHIPGPVAVAGDGICRRSGAAATPVPTRASCSRLAALAVRCPSPPPGFSLVVHNDWRATGGQPVDHFMLSDGLASVSIYVEAGDPREGLEGGTHIGAVHAVGKRVAGHQITVVGEVPPETVETVLAGIRHASEGRR